MTISDDCSTPGVDPRQNDHFTDIHTGEIREEINRSSR